MKPSYLLVNDCFEYLKEVNKLIRRNWIFRGHCVSCINPAEENNIKKNQKLITSLNRFLDKHKKVIKSVSWYPREEDHLQRFITTAKGFLHNFPDDSDSISWLGLMQHFGYPTRLLDFTFNPTVALFFAFENASSENQYIGVHALHIDTIRKRSKKILASKNINPTYATYFIGKKGQIHDFMGITTGKWSNERQEAQEGVFLVSSKIDLDIESWISSIPENEVIQKPHWYKFALPIEGKEYYKRLKELKNIGIAPNRIYPGLIGTCGFYKWSWFDQRKNLTQP